MVLINLANRWGSPQYDLIDGQAIYAMRVARGEIKGCKKKSNLQAG